MDSREGLMLSEPRMNPPSQGYRAAGTNGHEFWRESALSAPGNFRGS